jgi:hypothetical protein
MGNVKDRSRRASIGTQLLALVKKMKSRRRLLRQQTDGVVRDHIGFHVVRGLACSLSK